MGSDPPYKRVPSTATEEDMRSYRRGGSDTHEGQSQSADGGDRWANLTHGGVDETFRKTHSRQHVKDGSNHQLPDAELGTTPRSDSKSSSSPSSSKAVNVILMRCTYGLLCILALLAVWFLLLAIIDRWFK